MKKHTRFKITFLLLAIACTGCLTKNEWAEVFMKKGESYLKKGKYERALEEFVKSQHYNSSAERLYENLARTYLKMNNQSKAIEALNRVIQLNPDCSAEIYFLRGEAVAMNPVSRPEAITAGYNKAIAKDPSQAKYYVRRAYNFKKLGRHDLAAQDLAEARRLGYTE